MKEQKILESIIEQIELPDRAYEQAVERYEALQDWVKKPTSKLAGYDPHVFVQGSFALGTAIKPVDPNDDYDLDLSTKLRTGVTQEANSQEQLKTLLGEELAAYAKANGFNEGPESKRRCWRLNYSDSTHGKIGFHMDVVPGIPEKADRSRRRVLLMEQRQMTRQLAESLVKTAMSITDDQHAHYKAQNAPEWPSSNPEGYTAWFQHQMRGTQDSTIKAEAQFDNVPLYRRKRPLQRIVQLLKWHRDQMFRSPTAKDSKPISAIITTLAATYYEPGADIVASLRTVLQGLKAFADSGATKVPNPVNPEENFADKWEEAAYAKYDLKGAFKRWAYQVSRDFEKYLSATSPQLLREAVQRDLGYSLSVQGTDKAFGGVPAAAVAAPTILTRPRIEIGQQSPKPWGSAE